MKRIIFLFILFLFTNYPQLNCTESPYLPVYFNQDTIKTVNDQVYLTIQGEPFFALGFDVTVTGPWDGIAGSNECSINPVQGVLNNAAEMSQQAVDYGANFAYVWSYEQQGFNTSQTIVDTDPQIYGRWTPGWGIDRPKDQDVIPIIVNKYGEVCLEGLDPSIMAADFNDFQNRTGEWSGSNYPNLPPFEDLPYFAWHPSYRMRVDDVNIAMEGCCTDPVAEAYAKATNMMIGDHYTYVENYHEEAINTILGLHGDKGEGYDDWLRTNDPFHQRYFTASWDLVKSLRERAHSNTVIWMWMQGYAFNDGIGLNACWNGLKPHDLWACGSFPTKAYLRKEITSTIVAGGTGIIFFGYMYNREDTADIVRSFFRALSNEQVYEPVLLSPRLDLEIDTKNIGQDNRAHLLIKWHQQTKTAYIIGSNPGAFSTSFTLDFPWTIAKAEMLDWDTAAFVINPAVKVKGTAINYRIPRDDGFIVRITPLME